MSLFLIEESALSNLGSHLSTVRISLFFLGRMIIFPHQTGFSGTGSGTTVISHSSESSDISFSESTVLPPYMRRVQERAEPCICLSTEIGRLSVELSSSLVVDPHFVLLYSLFILLIFHSFHAKRWSTVLFIPFDRLLICGLNFGSIFLRLRLISCSLSFSNDYE